jgi:carboxylesterase type B
VYAGWGASHYAELWYVFDHLSQTPWRWSIADRKVAEEISNYWVNFARSGNPNGTGPPGGLHSPTRITRFRRSDHGWWGGEYQ